MSRRAITVYRVLTDIDAYQDVLSDESPLPWEFDGTPIGKRWKPPKVYVPNPSKKEPDLWGCFNTNAVFAASPRAVKLLAERFFEETAELLPLVFEGHELAVVNITYVFNCLDKEHSEHVPGYPSAINKYVFHPNRLGKPLFKIPQTRMSEIFCCEGFTAPDQEFRAIIEKHRLAGLRFGLVWSSEPEKEPKPAKRGRKRPKK